MLQTSPSPQSCYAEHIAERQRATEAALAAEGYDGIIVHSGTHACYFADDQTVPFKATPHLLHWLPLDEPGHVLVLRAGQRPLLLYRVRKDYWYEQAELGDPFWANHFEIVQTPSAATARAALPKQGRLAFVGPTAAIASELGVDGPDVNPAGLSARLDWGRSIKTPYEIACIRSATAKALPAHAAAREAFLQGASELDIHHAYMQRLGATESELPYPSIVALDEKGAVLHYEGKRHGVSGDVLLIDNGARHLGYACDITRTHTGAGVPALFRDLVAALDTAQRELCALVAPGVDFVDLHRRAEVMLGELLHAIGVLRVPGADAAAAGWMRPFFPHGLGHLLGLQVHDVAGRQRAVGGGTRPPPDGYPTLRTTRILEPGMVVTIEPGIYFIDMLLTPFIETPGRDACAWDLVDALRPCGGARIEDNVLVTAKGHENLTRAASR